MENEGYTEMFFQYMRVDGVIETVLEFLLRRFRYLNQEQWQENIRTERILVNGEPVEGSEKLKNGQKVTYLRPDFMEPEVDPFFESIYEDEDLIALNKSGDLPTVPSGKYFKNTLLHKVKSHFNWEKLYTLHRLDRETSGVVLFAKNHRTAQRMSQMFRERQIQKAYVAVLSQPLASEEVEVSLPIGVLANSLVRIKQGVTDTGKFAQTRFRHLEYVGTGAKVEVLPLTGRTHQIRVHAAHMKCPIVGDKLYGLSEEGFVRWITEGNSYLESIGFPTHTQLLHAKTLSFLHPTTAEEIVICAEDTRMMQLISHNK